MNIGLFLPNWVGDAVMATPALRALRKRFADATITGIMRPAIADVLDGGGWMDDYILYDPRSANRSLRSWNVLRTLRRRRLDQVVLFTNSWRTGLLSRATGARERIGYDRQLRRLLLTRWLQSPRDGRRTLPHSALDAYLELAYEAGCPPESKRLELATMPADERAADDAWRHLALPTDRQVVVLNTGGAFGPAKLWPQGYFSALARRIVTHHDRSVLVLCGPHERELARQIVRGAGHPRIVTPADLPLSIGLSKACVRRAALMVTTDSGPRHFAAAFDVPVVTLFGPTRQAWSDNYHDRAVQLQLDLACSPCQQRECPLEHHRCMRDLSVETVYRAVADVLNQLERTHAA